MIDYLQVKSCTKCLLKKDILDFGVDKQKKDGRSSHCKCCKRLTSKNHYSQNVDYYKLRNQNFYSNLPPEKKILYRATNNMKPSTKIWRKQWQRENKKKISEYARKWASKIPLEILAQKRKEYRKRNPDVFARLSLKRRRSSKLASPKWLSVDDLRSINLIYLKRDFINEMTGIPHQVDHIFPIQGKDSCGLHVPWNLQILTAEENRKKINSLPSYV